ncbi:low-specificity L-threonine aldolase [Malassezia cuniculi]|uniref:Low-specificity L-threonine aldolase n=1 Tax=Malassezia cuniculi TaxID=948313 RepID=A0AAF0ETE8_9BASI|nr:low-specificity L-threonine aldolase [Malassezia cuniculi]
MSLRHSVTLSIACPNRSTAETLVNVISVDKELRPHDVTKTFTITDTADGAQLHVDVKATTLRHLRLAVNAFLEDSALVVRTIDAFGEQGQVDIGAGDLEQGSTGRAG